MLPMICSTTGLTEWKNSHLFPSNRCACKFFSPPGANKCPFVERGASMLILGCLTRNFDFAPIPRCSPRSPFWVQFLLPSSPTLFCPSSPSQTLNFQNIPGKKKSKNPNQFTDGHAIKPLKTCKRWFKFSCWLRGAKRLLVGIYDWNFSKNLAPESFGNHSNSGIQNEEYTFL